MGKPSFASPFKLVPLAFAPPPCPLSRLEEDPVVADPVRREWTVPKCRLSAKQGRSYGGEGIKKRRREKAKRTPRDAATQASYFNPCLPKAAMLELPAGWLGFDVRRIRLGKTGMTSLTTKYCSVLRVLIWDCGWALASHFDQRKSRRVVRLQHVHPLKPSLSLGQIPFNTKFYFGPTLASISSLPFCRDTPHTPPTRGFSFSLASFIP
ncbi:hypothetical protein V8C37DRAFT_393723 [Trichoderma ceciliae]